MIPSHVELRSSLYPTYKSKRPISVATQKFLQWLETLPAGPVILCGHSMGGLLAADASTSPNHAASKRVIGLIGYDVPFLGMHPHVVISGIASLLPHKHKETAGHGPDGNSARLRTEKEMNDERHVNIPSPVELLSPSPSASQVSLGTPSLSSDTLIVTPPLPSISPTPIPNGVKISSSSYPSGLIPDSEALSLSSGPLLAPPPLPPRPSSAPPRPTPSSDAKISHSSHSCSLVSHTLDFIESHANDRVVHFINKHRTDPISAATRWVIESLEFGVSIFDLKELRSRYAALERWHGDWIVFWTETVPPGGKDHEMPVKHNDDEGWDLGRENKDNASVGSLLEIASVTDSFSSSSFFHDSHSSTSSLDVAVEAHVSGPVPKSNGEVVKTQAKQDQTVHDKDFESFVKKEGNHCKVDFKGLKKYRHSHSPHHFVLRPKLTEHWEQVKVHGAKDEVEAHLGLFMRDVNQEYDQFLQRAAKVIKGWVDNLALSS